MNLKNLTASEWKAIVQPEDARYQARIDALVAQHLGWEPVTSRHSDSERRAWLVGGLTYNNLRAVRALYRLEVFI